MSKDDEKETEIDGRIENSKFANHSTKLVFDPKKAQKIFCKALRHYYYVEKNEKGGMDDLKPGHPSFKDEAAWERSLKERKHALHSKSLFVLLILHQTLISS